MDIEQISDGIKKVIFDEVKNSLTETEFLLSYRPHHLDRIPAHFLNEDVDFHEEIDIECRAVDLRKMVMNFLEERDGSYNSEEDSECLKNWATEFEMYAKKFRKKAEKLDAEDPEK